MPIRSIISSLTHEFGINSERRNEFSLALILDTRSSLHFIKPEKVDQTLMWLQDDKKLADYKIKSTDELTLMMRLKQIKLRFWDNEQYNVLVNFSLLVLDLLDEVNENLKHLPREAELILDLNDRKSKYKQYCGSNRIISWIRIATGIT
jgi:hypothetical protein